MWSLLSGRIECVTLINVKHHTVKGVKSEGTSQIRRDHTNQMDRFNVDHIVIRWSFVAIQPVGTHLPVDHRVEYQVTPSSQSNHFFKWGKKCDWKWLLYITVKSPRLTSTDNSDRDFATAAVFFLLLVGTQWWENGWCVGGGERMGSVDECFVVRLVMIITVVFFDADAIVRSVTPRQRSARAMKWWSQRGHQPHELWCYSSSRASRAINGAWRYNS